MYRRGEMSANQLGKEVGVSHVTIGNYLVGQPPKSVHLVSIAKFFGVSTDWLLGLAGESMFDNKGGIRANSPGPLVLMEAPHHGENKNLTGDLELWKRRAKDAEQELATLKTDLRALLNRKPNSKPLSDEQVLAKRAGGIS